MTPHLSRGRSRRLVAGTALISLALTGLTTAGTATAVDSTAPTSEAATSAPAPVRTTGPLTAGRYLVTFAGAPAAVYAGGVAGYESTRPAAGEKLDSSDKAVVRYRARLSATHDKALKAVGATKLHDYTVVTNGVAVDLTQAQAEKLARRGDVLALEKDAISTLDTTATPAFLGLSKEGGLWSQLGGNTEAGSGIIVGIIDSGVWPESESFAGAPLGDGEISGLRGPWTGECETGDEWDLSDCNSKLIGARFYVDGFGAENISEEEFLSPRDGDGHGSHTASTAAGNRVENVIIDGSDYGAASGMAPGAMIASYKVCWEANENASAGCFNSDSVKAIDDAVADGVDVINYSIGSSSESQPLDSVELAFLNAAAAGVYVAASAGNSGPGVSTLDHPSPWLTTVAASTFRTSSQDVVLGDGQSFEGASLTASLPTQTPLVRSVDSALPGADSEEARLCFPDTLDPALVAGKVVQCDRGVNARIDKSFAVKNAGGVGMILTNTSVNSLNSDLHAVPTVHLPVDARPAVLAYIATAGAAATAAIVPAPVRSSAPTVPEVAAFSSRGPSTTTEGDILKPDISAPGVDVIAAVAPPTNNGRSYDAYSGTSMSSPHIAGIAALVRASHPDWTPMMVKSALMTTARNHVTTTDPFAQGAGFVVPNSAVDPGLVLDSDVLDWIGFLDGLYDLGIGLATDASDLNQASIAVGSLPGTQTVTRTVTNVSTKAETYKSAASLPGVKVVVSPDKFRLAPGASQELSITFTRGTAPLGEYAKGRIVLNGNRGHSVRLPVVVRPVALAAPLELTGEGTDGASTYTVDPGFTGTLTSTVTGLVGATPESGTVTAGPLTDGDSPSTKVFTVTVEPGATLARFDLDAINDDDDLDLFVFLGDELVGVSASGAADEQVTLDSPAPGTYDVLVNGFGVTEGGGAFEQTSWSVGSTAVGNLTVSPSPTAVAVGTPEELTATWSGLDPSLRYLGLIRYEGTGVQTIVSIDPVGDPS